MKFNSPLQKGRLISRYKRFLSDIELSSGETITAHIANPGAMTGLAKPGAEVWVSLSDNPKRKLPFSWELVRVGRHLVDVNTSHANRVVEESLAKKGISELAAYNSVRREVAYGKNSRCDFLLKEPGLADCWLEVKNVSLKRGNRAEFPDSVTTRGSKLLYELMDVVTKGERAVMLYVVQRADCASFSVAADIDPAYGAAMELAKDKGVEFLCYVCKIRKDGLYLDHPLPFTEPLKRTSEQELIVTNE